MAIHFTDQNLVACDCGNTHLVKTDEYDPNGILQRRVRFSGHRERILANDPSTVFETLFWCCACGAMQVLVDEPITQTIPGTSLQESTRRQRWERREWSEREKRFAPVPV